MNGITLNARPAPMAGRRGATEPDSHGAIVPGACGLHPSHHGKLVSAPGTRRDVPASRISDEVSPARLDLPGFSSCSIILSTRGDGRRLTAGVCLVSLPESAKKTPVTEYPSVPESASTAATGCL